MADIESGVRRSLRSLGIIEPSTALELLAIKLAQALDSNPAETSMAALSRELRLTLDQVASQPSPVDDPVDELAKRTEARSAC